MSNIELDSAELRKHCQQWLSKINNIEPIERNQLTWSVLELYKNCFDKPQPNMIVCQSPWQLMIMKCLLQHGIDDDTAIMLKKPPINPFAIPEWRSMWSSVGTTIENETTSDLRTKLLLNHKPRNKNFLVETIKQITEEPVTSGVWSKLPSSLGDISSVLARQLEHAAIKHFGKEVITKLEAQYLAAYPFIETNNHQATQIKTQLRLQATGMQPLQVTAEYMANMAAPFTSIINLVCNLSTSADYRKRSSSQEQLQYEIGVLSLLSLDHALMTCSLLGRLPLIEFLLDKVGSFKIESVSLKKLLAVLQFCKATPCALLFDSICLLSERPIVCQIDTDYRLHNESGPALAFSDDFKIYSWHGTTVPQQVIEQPDTITANKIIAERNTEIRRVMVERFGTARFISESGARKMHEDDFGILYRKEMRHGEPFVMVKVINSTPEAGGIRREYFIRVPPNIRTAREAVAWTFNIAAKDYSPDSET